ncbi:helix-turn-helix transcriptional regulator [Flagellatimonas centrodinii]|uniref:helix-turn-helix domain-containing protein n=1 Tax=Flagellatimonas centrodinii TaxID=2806210 RepID=UPI001FED8BE3|nr:helix-turn-helix transcriptional regulator [Flagellatimonas centrodinii]ULQ45950.1 helix-turn-helix transcriptional regulator [Flagellatimonas centrodinii]
MADSCNRSYTAPSTSVTHGSVNLCYMWPGRGNRIRKRREDLGYSHEDLARAMGPIRRVTRQAILKWEADDNIEIKERNLDALAHGLGMPRSEILGAQEPGNHPNRVQEEPGSQYSARGALPGWGLRLLDDLHKAISVGAINEDDVAVLRTLAKHLATRRAA